MDEDEDANNAFRGFVSSRVKGSRCIVMAVMFLIR